ncbi:adhesion G protein-coupled receptor B1-like isoform X1 [Hydra vulgaris]|uniref:Adhesion G protein-coupled receptor B1-like isoform X1 n=1 Tax=Hydra vulgaris TaxID=6087 RepID=A0ABM4BAR5_HYDVU
MFLWTWILYLIFIRDTRVQHKYSLSRCIYGFVNIACSASCQLVYTVPTQTSTRTCSGASLGVNCNSQALTQTENCNVLFPGILNGWGSWSACSASCNTQVNGPYQYRSQTCIVAFIWNPNYVGCNNVSLNDQQLCNQNVPCSSFISAWGACSASCQLSFTLPTQTRNCQYIGAIFNGSCNGAVFTDTQNCNEQVYCPGTISDWSFWGACSSICNNFFTVPFQTRSQICIGYLTWDPNYKGCPGITTSDQQTCNINVACSGTYGAWSAWNSCSESCQSNPATTPFQTQTISCLGARLGD